MKRNAKGADCMRPSQKPSARGRLPTMQRRGPTAVGDCPMQSQTLPSRVSYLLFTDIT